MAGWRGDLEAWLAPFLDALGHAARRRVCPAYVAGLIEVGERKSMQPMALRDGTVGYDQLHHFIAAETGTWRRWKWNSCARRTGCSAGMTPS